MSAREEIRVLHTSSPRTRFLTIATLEFRMQLANPLFWALLLLLVGAVSTLNPVAMMRGGAAVGEARVFANSAWALTPSFAMSGFFVYPFFAAVMAGLSALRDDDVGMTELLESTPLTRHEHVWAKYVGLAATLGVALLIHVIVFIVFRELSIGGTARGPFRLFAYLEPALLFAAPTALWCAGLAFAIAHRTRQTIWAYALPVLLFVAEFLWLWNWHPAGINRTLDGFLMVLDPTGLRWISHRLYAADPGLAVVNTRPLALDVTVLVGRIWTIVFPLGAIAVATRRRSPQRISGQQAAPLVVRAWQRFGILLSRKTPQWVPWSRSPNATTTTAAPARSPFTAMLDGVLPMQRVSPTLATGSITVMWAELRELMRRPSTYVSALVLFMVVADAGGAEADVYGSLPLLTAGGVAVAVLPAVTVLSCLFLLFTLVELLHRDQTSGFEPLALSSSTSTAAFLAGRGLASVIVQAMLTLACAASVAVLLYTRDGAARELWPLWLIFGGVLGPTIVLWVSFVLLVMSVTRSRAASLAIGFGAILLTAAQFIGGTLSWLTNWPVFGALRWTEFAVFPLDGAALLTNRLLALVLSALFFVAACRVFERTERDPRRTRDRRTARRLGRTFVSYAPLLGLPLLVGGFLSVRIHEGGRPALAARAASRAAPERGQVDGPSSVASAPPVIRRIDLSLALEPEQHRMGVVGWYDLVNESHAAVLRVPIRIPRTLGPVDFVVDQGNAATQATTLPAAAQSDLHLARPMLSGDTVRIRFRYTAVIPRGYSRNGGERDAFILPAAVYLSTHRGDFLPEIGEIAAAFGSVGLRPVAAIDAPGAGFNSGRSFTLAMRVTAPSDLVVSAVGAKLHEARNGGRTMVTWGTSEPVAAISVIAGRYAVQRRAGVAVYHWPAHGQSVPVIVETLAAARKYYGAWFAPYPWPELRLAEFPDLQSQATSFPTSIAVSEGLGFLADTLLHGGLPFAVTAHEAAHQWWGHMLAAGDGPGTGLLIEGMADYSTLLLAEQRYGAAARTAMAARFESQYLRQRVTKSEQPLMDTREGSPADGAVLQKKGALAIWMLHQQLGPARMFSGLQRFIGDHRATRTFATLEEMLTTLRAESTDTAAFDRLVTQVFRSTALPEFGVSDPQCKPEAVRWACTARVQNRGQGSWNVTVVAMVGARVPVGGRQTIQVRAGFSTPVSFTVDELPDQLVVDPDVHVLQLERARAHIAVPRESLTASLPMRLGFPQ